MLDNIRMRQVELVLKRRKRNRRIVFLLVLLLFVAIAAFLLWNSVQNKTFEITRYQIESDKIEGFRIALLSDLHNREFGENNCDLVNAIKEAAPDIILMCGDMVMDNDPDIGVVTNLCSQLKDVADIYYILGNHEGVLEYRQDGLQVPLDKYLWEMGVTVCYSGEYTIKKGDSDISLFAASMKEEDYEKDIVIQNGLKNFEKRDSFKILASHYPAIIYGTLFDTDFDLAVAGHFHGGLAIIPGIGGVYHTDTGFFPEYYGGIYQLGKGELVVTRGLGESSVFPRINNKPELVLIDINM